MLRFEKRNEEPSKYDFESNDYACEEATVKWVENRSNGEDLESISSEDENGSEFEYECEDGIKNKNLESVWKDEEVWSGFQTLSDAESLIDKISKGDYEELLQNPKNYSTILLVATWLEKNDLLEDVLERGAPIDVKDACGRSALHLAATIGNVEAIKLLIDHGMQVDAWENRQKVTPLHCAASKGKLECVKALIAYGADVNAAIKINKSPLHFAVQGLAVSCVKELLEHGAIPNSSQVYTETPLHIAAALGSSEIISHLLDHNAAVDVQCGFDKVTPLHLAAGEGDPICCQLLITKGQASVECRNHKQQTPLHLAALSQCAETMELLLKAGANPNAMDIDGRTPLHSSIVKATRTCDCVRLLLKKGVQVNKPDKFGYTALHLAALQEFAHCVMLLINSGGDVTARTKGGISVLNFITRKTPDVINKYKLKFDNSVRLNDHEIGDVDCELKLDLRPLVPTVGNREMDLLLSFVEVGHREVLKHPLCETFLFLKWRRIRKFFLFSLFFHMAFVCLYTAYIINVFLKDCTPKDFVGLAAPPKPSSCTVDNLTKGIGYFVLLLNNIMLAKEIFQFCHSWSPYLKYWENWMQSAIIISVFLCVQPIKHHMNIRINVTIWQHHVAAISIFLTWLELMMIVGRFPIFGLYIQMFRTVSINFLKFIAAYFCLLLAFGLSFGVIFANYKSFEKLFKVIIKIIVMMSGELEYEDIFFDEEHPIKFHGTAEIMFLIFVVLVTIILTNLMVGLAVSDIQGLQMSAGLDRLERQAHLISHLENMLFSRLLNFVPYKLMRFLHRQSLLLKSQYHWALYIRPNDPREKRLPKELLTDIYNLVVEKKEKNKKRMRKRLRDIDNYTTIGSPALTRMNSYMSYVDVSVDCPEPPVTPNKKSFRSQFEELHREFNDYTRAFKNKMDKLRPGKGSKS